MTYWSSVVFMFIGVLFKVLSFVSWLSEFSSMNGIMLYTHSLLEPRWCLYWVALLVWRYLSTPLGTYGRCNNGWPPTRIVYIVWHYLYNTTCLMRPHFALCVLRRVKDRHKLLHCLPLLMNTVASNRSTGNCLSNFTKRISSNNSNW